jgi:hypothetical protein
VWTFPAACKLTKVALHGKASTISSTNGLEDHSGGSLVPVDFVVFVNGVQVGGTLFTIPAGATDVDLSASPNTPIPAGAEMQLAFMADPTNNSGELANFLVSFSVKGV